MTSKVTPKRPFWVDATILVCAAVVFATMVALGNWQMKRLAWKIDLIEKVETRAFQPATELPVGPVTEDDHVYLRVRALGTFQHDRSILVKALTDLGAGAWVMTPFETSGDVLWVNRGFVPSGMGPTSWSNPEGQLTIEGLLRVTEPNGTLLERNEPARGRWVSRDVAAMSASIGLEDHYSYFVDADHIGVPEAWPRGGLTKTSFRNSHLSYAMTWYAMAILFLAAMAYVVLDRMRHGKSQRADM